MIVLMIHKQQRLNLYNIDLKYVKDLSRADSHVMSVSPQIGKEHRPFIGIIIVCNTVKYCVPLSSPKKKHETMKNDIDFTKIYHNQKLIGVLNFNNMIPVNDNLMNKIDILIRPDDSPEMFFYKKLLAKELTYCQKNQDAIIKKANKLYQMRISGKMNLNLQKRCCDFLKLEETLKNRT